MKKHFTIILFLHVYLFTFCPVQHCAKWFTTLCAGSLPNENYFEAGQGFVDAICPELPISSKGAAMAVLMGFKSYSLNLTIGGKKASVFCSRMPMKMIGLLYCCANRAGKKNAVLCSVDSWLIQVI